MKDESLLNTHAHFMGTTQHENAYVSHPQITSKRQRMDMGVSYQKRKRGCTMPCKAEDKGGRRASSGTGLGCGNGISSVHFAARLTWQLLSSPCQGLVFFDKRPPCPFLIY